MKQQAILMKGKIPISSMKIGSITGAEY